MIDGQHGRTLLSAPLAERARTRDGPPYLNVHRGDLQNVGLDAVKATTPTAVEVDGRASSVVQGDDAVAVLLTDGRTPAASVPSFANTP